MQGKLVRVERVSSLPHGAKLLITEEAPGLTVAWVDEDEVDAPTADLLAKRLADCSWAEIARRLEECIASS